mmetsp:Transcript_5111/g.6601  ORF Transcript_5111/g.6601 Transcript_5111/m.6601 type:complete len:202 (+) Transcript_5111:241-846(+)
MKYFVPFVSLSFIRIVSTNAFQQPSLTRKSVPKALVKSSVPIDVDFFNPARKLDFDHVHDCAEHFGQCSIQELEEMRGALHLERLQHEASLYRTSPLEELDHRLLEEDLDFQLALLKDEMHTLPSPHYITDRKPTFYPPHTVTQDDAGATAMNHRPKSDLKSFVRQSEEMFLIPNGFSDIVAFGLALLILNSIAMFHATQT